MSCIPFGTVIMDFFTFLLEAIFYYSDLVNWKHPQARYSDYITPGDRTPIAGVKTIIPGVSDDKMLVFAQNGIYKTVNRPANLNFFLSVKDQGGVAVYHHSISGKTDNPFNEKTE